MVSLKRNKICCEKLFSAIENEKIPVFFTTSKDCFGCGIPSLKWIRSKLKLVTPFKFCPWCGKESEKAFFCDLRYKIANECGNENLDVFSAEFDFEKDTPQQCLCFVNSKRWWEEKITTARKQHSEFRYCDALYDSIEHISPVLYLSNIRAYVIVKDKNISVRKYTSWIDTHPFDFESMDFCYKCGAKFPERLDEKLTEILRSEYDLNSWKDYKKAPAEFHSDEWWKKRGL